MSNGCTRRSAAQRLAEQRGGQQRDARTLGRGVGHRDRRVEDRAAHERRRHARGGEPARPFVRAIGAQQRLAGEVGGRAQPARDRGRAHGRQRRRDQRQGLRAVPGAVAEADRPVQALGGEVHAVVVGHQPQVDGRMRALERGQPRQQPADGEGAHHGQRHHLPVQAAFELLQHGVHALEAVGQQRQQRLALVRQREPARQPPEQRRAQARLEVLDLRADRGLRHVQLQRRAREAQVARRGLEGAHRVQGSCMPQIIWGLAPEISV